MAYRAGTLITVMLRCDRVRDSHHGLVSRGIGPCGETYSRWLDLRCPDSPKYHP